MHIDVTEGSGLLLSNETQRHLPGLVVQTGLFRPHTTWKPLSLGKARASVPIQDMDMWETTVRKQLASTSIHD